MEAQRSGMLVPRTERVAQPLSPNTPRTGTAQAQSWLDEVERNQESAAVRKMSGSASTSGFEHSRPGEWGHLQGQWEVGGGSWPTWPSCALPAPLQQRPEAGASIRWSGAV